METKFLLLLCFTIGLFQCTPSYEKQLDHLMKENQELLGQIEKDVQLLVLKRNQINIQGWALTTEEMAFTDKVNEIEFNYEAARHAIQDFPKVEADSSLVEKARQLHALLIETRRQVDSLKNSTDR